MSITLTTIESEVAYFLGYGYSSGAGGSTGDFLNNIADRALRQFVLPSPIEGESSAHKWSWLSGSGIVVLAAPVTLSTAGGQLHDAPSSSDTPKVVSGVVTFGLDASSGGVLPTFAYSSSTDHKTVMVEISGMGAADGWHIPTALTATTMTLADTSINVAETAVSKYDAVSGLVSNISFTFYQIMHASEDDFGSVDGSMYHDSNQGYNSLPITNIGAMRDLYAATPITPTVPEYVAYDDALGRFLFFPPPDKAYVLRYNYNKTNSSAESSLASLIPAKYEGVVINGALALAENYADTPNAGRFLKLYSSQLKSAIMEDRANHRSEYFGVNRDNSDRIEEQGYRTSRADIYYTNRSGTKYPS